MVKLVKVCVDPGDWTLMAALQRYWEVSAAEKVDAIATLRKLNLLLLHAQATQRGTTGVLLPRHDSLQQSRISSVPSRMPHR